MLSEHINTTPGKSFDLAPVTESRCQFFPYPCNAEPKELTGTHDSDFLFFSALVLLQRRKSLACEDGNGLSKRLRHGNVGLDSPARALTLNHAQWKHSFSEVAAHRTNVEILLDS